MTAPTKRASAYPATVADLVPQARKLAARLGELPSRNRLMTELHIGAPKAKELLAELRRLRLVPVTDDAEPDPADDRAESGENRSRDQEPTDETDPTEPEAAPTAEAPSTPVSDDADPGTDADTAPAQPRRLRRGQVSVLPVLLLTLPAFAAVWSGWVSLGGMAGFGVVHPLPGIADHVTLNTAITLPIGVEVYAAYALWVWLSTGIPDRARRFAKVSAIASLITGALGQVTYHLLSAAHYSRAPWPVTMLVACLPVAVLGMGAALAHLVRDSHE